MDYRVQTPDTEMKKIDKGVQKQQQKQPNNNNNKHSMINLSRSF